MRTIALLLCSVAIAAAQDDVKLTAKKVSVGDKAEVKIETQVDLDIAVKDSDGERAYQVSQVKSEKFQQDVTAVEDGTGLTLRVRCVGSDMQQTSNTQGVQKGKTPLDGKSFLVKRTAGVSNLEMTDGSDVPAGADGLGGWEEYARLLPANAVKVGDQWIVDKDVVALIAVGKLTESKGAQLVASLKSVEGGKATITFKGELEGKTSDNSMIKVSIVEGELVFDMSRGRPTLIKISGGFESTKDVVQTYVKPGTATKIPEKIGEIKTKTRKLEVKIEIQ